MKDLKNHNTSGVEFLGELPAEGFITGDTLASQIGLSAGTTQHSEAGWLHFVLDGVTLYVAKKPFRHSVSWNHIHDRGAVFGSREVVINGETYKVRLLRSAVDDGYMGSTNGVFDPTETYGSEWNRLMYPIHSPKHSDTRNPTPVSGEGIQFGSLGNYTDTELVTHSSGGDGSQSWCQESSVNGQEYRVFRGAGGVSFLFWPRVSDVVSGKGWRPVLELVE